MTDQEKEATLREIETLPEAEKMYVLGWCAHAAAQAQKDKASA